MTTATATGPQHIARATESLAAVGCPDPQTDAAALLSHAFHLQGKTPASVPDAPIPSDVADSLAPLLARRIAREPLAYILGACDFRGLRLSVDSRVLVPQPRFGTLVAFALSLPAKAAVHDVGTGSGALALALKHERPDLTVSGSDVSPEAIQVARANATSLGLDVTFTVAAGLPAGEYALVLAHLPYVDDDEHTLAIPPEESRHQPHIALYAGTDGLSVIRDFLSTIQLPTLVALGHAPTQGPTVRSWLADARTANDIYGEPRYTLGLADPRRLAAALRPDAQR